MSLTDHLTQADSAVRIFLEGVSPLVRQAKGSSRRARAAAEILGLDRAASLEQFVTLSEDLPKSQWSGPIGTAFDARVRMLLGDVDLDTSKALEGLSTLMPGTHEFRVFVEVLEVARLLLQRDDPEDHDRAAIALAWCESLARSPYALAGSWGTVVQGTLNGASLVQAIPQLVLDDLQQLRNVGGAFQIAAWRSVIQGGARYVPNPMFSSGEVVDGADGDWMVGDTLVDCKTTSKLNRTKLRGYVLQLLGYVLLDENDDLGIRQVAVWLPRYGETFTWSLAELLGSDPQRVLPALRKDFKRVVRNSAQALALHEEMTEKRGLGLIAENKHTPLESLDAMGSSTELAVRVKVAGNPNTPAHRLISLSRDSRLEVRARVAGNPNTPRDVLERLKNDRSANVCRAAEMALYDRTAITAGTNSTRRQPVVIAEPRLRDRSGLDPWTLYWFENTELAGYWDYRVEFLWSRRLFESTKGAQLFRAYTYRENDDEYRAERERLNREFDPEKWEELDRLKQELRAEMTLADECVAEDEVDPPRAMVVYKPSPPSDGELLLAASQDMNLSEVERSRALDRLSRRDEVRYRAEAAESRHADVPMLLRLSMDRRAEVRAAVARNGRTPLRILEFLSGERSVLVRREGLRNTNLPERALRSLSEDKDEAVRLGVAHHMSTPADLLGELTDSDSLLFSMVAVLNLSTPIDTIQAMREDPDPLIRKVVAATLTYRESAMYRESVGFDYDRALRHLPRETSGE